MQFKENAGVFTPGGEKIGRLDRVVIDPGSYEVTHLVTKKGLFFSREKVIPIESVESATADRVVLKQRPEDPDTFPDYEEKEHIPLGSEKGFQEAGSAGRVTWYPARAGLPWWGNSPYPVYMNPSFIVKTEQRIPEGTVPLEEGAKVVAKSGDPVGDVEQIFTEPEQNHVTHLLIAKGLISKDKKLIPSSWVERLSEDTVHLSVRTDLIESLPAYQGEDEE